MSLPLTSSFISELLILIGNSTINIILTIIICIGIFFSTIYNIWLLNRLLYGKYLII